MSAATASARLTARTERGDRAPLRPALRYDPVLLGVVLLLTTFGVVMVYSSSAVFAAEKLHDGLWYFKRQAVGALLGLCALLFAMKLGYQRLEKLAVPLLVLSAVLLVLVQFPGLGHSAGGARRWLRLGPLTFQPSELAKIALVLWLARSLARKQDKLEEFTAGLLPHLMMLGVFAGLLMMEPDFGTTVVLTACTFGLLFVAGARTSWLLGMVLSALPVGALLIVTSKYRMERVTAFLHPFENIAKSGYQTVESLTGFGAGGAFGVGLGESTQKLFFLPAAHTDFILSIVGEELGFVGVASVLLLFAALVWRGLKAAHASPDAFGAFLALGLTLLFSLEALVNAGMALSLLPTKGMALPFLSYGMSQVVTSLFAAGILLSVSGGHGGFLKRPDGGRR